MTDSISQKLKEIEEQLVAKESELTSELAILQEKLSSIRSVVAMFKGESESSEAAEDSVPTEGSPVEEPAAPSPVVAKKPAAKKQTAAKKKTSKKKKDGRAATWQKYTRPGVKNESIPDAVKLVLATQPDKEFKIAEVMDALFKETMPKSQYTKARNRVSNVLSGGVRAGDWHKGSRGSYRLSAA